MTIYLVHHSGDGTDNGAANTMNPTATDWGKAEASMTSALLLATTAGDIILVDADHAETVTATAGTIAADIAILVVDKDASNVAATMGETRGAWTSNNTSVTVFSATNRRIRIRGFTAKLTGSSIRSLTWFSGDNNEIIVEDCTGWNASTSTGGSSITLVSAGDPQTYRVKVLNYTDRRDNAAHLFISTGDVMFIGGGLSANGAAVTNVFRPVVTRPGGCNYEFYGFDCSAAASTATLVSDNTVAMSVVRWHGCKVPSSFSMLATQTNNSSAAAEVHLHDCYTASSRNICGYANGLGSCITEDTIKFTSGAAGRSWKITTTAYVTPSHPFYTPWIDWYNSTNTSISPYFEILRNNDSTTAYDDDEVWLEAMYKNTSGADKVVLVDDGMDYLGTPAAQDNGAGLGSWDSESGSCWSGKVQVTLAAAEDGFIRFRFGVGVETAGKLFIDPEPRV